MTEDRSLEEFAAGRDAAADADDGSDADATGDSDADADAPTPAVATYRWDPEGVDCAACGESVERLWNAEEGFVCESCKEW